MKHLSFSFAQVCVKAVTAMASGYVSEQQIYGHSEWEELRKFLDSYDHETGVWSNMKQRKEKPKKAHVPRTLKTAKLLDAAVRKYLMYAALDPEAPEADDMDRRLIDQFSPDTLFGNTMRLKRLYQDLLGYAAWRRDEDEGDEEPMDWQDVEPNRRNLVRAVRSLPREDRVLTRQVRLLNWEVVTGEEEQGPLTLDLTDYIAWRIDEQHVGLDVGFFAENRFYELAMDEEILRRGLKMTNKRKRTEEEERNRALRRNTFAYDEEGEAEAERRREAKERRIAYSIGMDHRPLRRKDNNNLTDFEVKHPLLSEAKKVFLQVAGGDVTAHFVSGKNAVFMLRHYDQLMRSSESRAGVARKKQYDYVDALHEVFDHGHLNTVSGEYASPMCVARTADVEPSQDVMVQHFLSMAKTSGVLQLTVEFVMMLMANVVGFTCHDNKPILALNGPPGAGKSHTALAARRIAVGSDVCLNNPAFECQDYATIRSMTAARENEYERVSGTKFIEEWRCGDGGENSYSRDTSMEATTFKNIWDKGMVNTERCIKKDKSERVASEKHQSLFSQSIVVLANGISLAPSLEDRFLIFDVPPLTVEVHHVDAQQMACRLSASRLVHLFSLYRFHVSEGINLRTIGLEIKERSLDQDLDAYESRLTFSRMHRVLTDMKLPKNCKKLTPRTEKQICLFAEVISRWRAVTEVLGFRQSQTAPATLEQDRDRLKSLNDETKTLWMEQRTVLDPADLVSAATMVLSFSDPATEVLKAVVQHLLDPDSLEAGVGGEGSYLQISTSIKQMVADLKASNKEFLMQTVIDALTDLEARKTERDGLPVIKRSSSNPAQRFDLCVEVRTAVSIFCNTQVDLLREAEQYLLDEMSAGRFNHRESRDEKYFNGNLKFHVPEHLLKAFCFLSLADREGSCKRQFRGATSFVMSANFGLLDVKLAKSLLKARLLNALNAEHEEEELFDSEGFATVDLTTEDQKFVFCPKQRSVANTLVACSVEPEPLFKSGGKRVHLAGLRGDRDLRDKIVRALDTVDDLHVRLSSEEAAAAIAGREDAEVAPFRKVRVYEPHGTAQLRVHYEALNNLRLLNCEYGSEESKPVSFVRRMLCKNMTSFDTVLCLDRETCYETQRPEDAFVFLPVPDDEELSEFAMPVASGRYNGGPTNRQRLQNQPQQQHFPNQNISTEKGEGYCTFHPQHRRIKLAYKQLLLKGAVQQARKDFADDEEQFQRQLQSLLRREKVREFVPPQLFPLERYPQSMR